MEHRDIHKELALKSSEATIYCAQLEKLKLRIAALENENQDLRVLVENLSSAIVEDLKIRMKRKL